MANVYQQDYKVTKEQRNQLNQHRSFLIWLTGLSGSGKSTIANLLEQKLYEQSIHTYTLDGDNIRLGINKNLGFSIEDRTENIRRIGEVGKLFVDAGIVTIAAFVSPIKKDRENLRKLLGKDNFVEIHLSTPIEACEERDVKGLYAKARAGEIKDFTGISSPYEVSDNPDLTIDTSVTNLEDSVESILSLIKDRLTLK